MSYNPTIQPPADGTGSADLGGAMKRRWRVLLMTTCIGLLAGALHYRFVERPYVAKATVLLVALPGEAPPGGGRDRTLDVGTQATVARSTVILEAVASGLGADLEDVRHSSKVTPAATGDVLYVAYEADTAAEAVAGATTYADEMLAARKKAADDAAAEQRAEVQVQVDELTATIADLTITIEEEKDKGDDASATEIAVLEQRQSLAIRDLAAARDDLYAIDTDLDAGRVIVEAGTSVSRNGLNRSLTLLAGLFIGLLVGVFVALLRDRGDDRLGRAALADSVGAEEIGAVSLVGRRQAPSEADRRAYSRLIMRLRFAGGQSSARRVVLVVAAESKHLPPDAVALVTEALIARAPENRLTATASRGELSGSADGDEDLHFLVAGPLDTHADALSMASTVDLVALLAAPSTSVGVVSDAVRQLRSVGAEEVALVSVQRSHGRAKR